jgi:hypothetical protein
MPLLEQFEVVAAGVHAYSSVARDDQIGDEEMRGEALGGAAVRCKLPLPEILTAAEAAPRRGTWKRRSSQLMLHARAA